MEGFGLLHQIDELTIRPVTSRLTADPHCLHFVSNQNKSMSYQEVNRGKIVIYQHHTLIPQNQNPPVPLLLPIPQFLNSSAVPSDI